MALKIRAGTKPRPVPPEVEIFEYWNSQKGSALPKHKSGGTRLYRTAMRRIKSALKKYSADDIKTAITSYNHTLQRPDLYLHKKRSPPFVVGLDEFFEFSPDSRKFLFERHPKGFERMDSWFGVLIGVKREEIDRRFMTIPEDKYPIVTSTLKRIVTSWDRHPSINGTEEERILRIASCKLVELHQRIKPRITSWRKVEVLSPAEFLKERLRDYILNNLNLVLFELYWMLGERFYRDFERYLEKIGAIACVEEFKPRPRYEKPSERDFMTCKMMDRGAPLATDDPTIPDHLKPRSN